MCVCVSVWCRKKNEFDVVCEMHEIEVKLNKLFRRVQSGSGVEDSGAYGMKEIDNYWEGNGGGDEAVC